MDVVQFATLTASLVGAAAWTPTIYKHFRNPKLDGKIISLYSCFYRMGQSEVGRVHVFAINLTSLHKNLYIKDIKARIKYTEKSTDTEAEWGWFRKLTFDFEQGKEFKLCVTPEETLPYANILPNNNTVLRYIALKTGIDSERKESLKIDSLELEFIDFSNKKYSLKLNVDENGKMIFDDRIFIEE